MTEDLGWLDTNLFVIPFFRNDPQRPRCLAILQALHDGTARGWLDVIVVHELTYVLQRTGVTEFRTRDGIQAYVRDFLMLSAIHAEDKDVLLETVSRWARQGVGFADARLATLAHRQGRPVCSVNIGDFPDTENTFTSSGS